MKMDFIEGGRVVNTHGVRGELKIETWTDDPAFLAGIKTLYIDGAPHKLISAREHKNMLLVLLEGVDDINAAMVYKGKTVSFAREDALLPEGGYFLCELMGARCVDEAGREIGSVADMLETPAGAVYVIKGEKEHLVPAVPAFIASADPEAGVVVIRMIEGL